MSWCASLINFVNNILIYVGWDHFKTNENELTFGPEKLRDGDDESSKNIKSYTYSFLFFSLFFISYLFVVSMMGGNILKRIMYHKGGSLSSSLVILKYILSLNSQSGENMLVCDKYGNSSPSYKRVNQMMILSTKDLLETILSDDETTSRFLFSLSTLFPLDSLKTLALLKMWFSNGTNLVP